MHAVRPASPDPVAASPLYEVEPTFPGVRPTVTWLRSLEQGGFIARTAATVVEFFILIGCFFSVVGILVWNDGVREHQRQEDNAIADREGGIGGSAAPAAAADPDAARLRQERDTARTDLRLANENLAIARGQARDAGQRETAAIRQVTDLTAQVATLTQQLDAAKQAGGNAAKLSQQNETLAKQLAEAQRALREHQQKAGQQEEGLRDQVARLTQHLTKAQQGGDAALRDLQAQLERAQRDLATAQEQSKDALADAQRQIESLKAQLEDRGRALTTAQAGAGDTAQLKTQLSQAQAESQRLKTAFDTAETARKALLAQNAELTTEVQGARQATQALDSQMKAVNLQLQESNRTKGAQGEEIARLKAQLAGMTDKAQAEAALKALQDKLDAATAANRELAEKLQKVGDPTALFTSLLMLANKNTVGFDTTKAQEQLSGAKDPANFVYKTMETSVALLTKKLNEITQQSNNNYDAIATRELAVSSAYAAVFNKIKGLTTEEFAKAKASGFAEASFTPDIPRRPTVAPGRLPGASVAPSGAPGGEAPKPEGKEKKKETPKKS